MTCGPLAGLKAFGLVAGAAHAEPNAASGDFVGTWVSPARQGGQILDGDRIMTEFGDEQPCFVARLQPEDGRLAHQIAAFPK